MFRRTLLRSGPHIIWRPHRINFHKNMQSLANGKQQENAADVPPNRSGGQATTAPQDKTQYQTDSLRLNRLRENTLTDYGDSYDISSITVKEMLHNIKSSLQKLKCDIQMLQDYRDREYAGGVVSIRNQLAQMFLSSTQNAQRKQQIANPIDVRINVYDQNELAYDVNLSTTIKQADLHPVYFDICLDTVFGAPKDLINRLLEWDKTREYQVYSIFGDHGEAWHKGFANTCPKPFKTWLSSILCLQKLESAISHNASPDLEILIQNQKEQVKKSIQEWDSSYTTDRSNHGKKRKECRKIIEEDYRERGLLTRIKENLSHGVNLDQ
ncbi:hypothetical protein BCON_0149g00120 [Botryotinia convoluta]|uniref:Uncharacterized protein n=1 Tax=Botryotinia convoluta TaxID=54673 RepID=A0A4Z1HTE2_9HELO|nr:hypothetical protein BCON_0149g00120 [Botryotinia convoluta]